MKICLFLPNNMGIPSWNFPWSHTFLRMILIKKNDALMPKKGKNFNCGHFFSLVMHVNISLPPLKTVSEKPSWRLPCTGQLGKFLWRWRLSWNSNDETELAIPRIRAEGPGRGRAGAPPAFLSQAWACPLAFLTQALCALNLFLVRLRKLTISSE